MINTRLHIRSVLILSILIFARIAVAQPIDLNITSPLNWELVMDEQDVSQAGEDVPSSMQSASDETIMMIEGRPAWWNPNHPNHIKFCEQRGRCDWQVEIERADNNWHSNLKLMVRRTSGPNNVYEGNLWREIHSYPEFFFWGQGNAENIHIQYEISGISVTIPADTYSTQVYYTVSDY